jgi:hypothetical protein
MLRVLDPYIRLRLEPALILIQFITEIENANVYTEAIKVDGFDISLH